MEEQKNTQDNKGTWMDRLALESWQAEMVISGVAIFGSFQLFDGVNMLIKWFYFTLPEGFMSLAYFLSFYLLIAVSVLTMSFLGHFLIRALWIAGIGLESVYPQGFLRENDVYSTHFMDQLIERFPSLKQFNQELDRVASAVLAYALNFVMVFVGIGIVLSVSMIIGLLLATFLDDDLAVNIMYGLMALYAATMFFNVMLNIKSLREKPWVKRIQYPMTIFLGSYLTASIFAKPQIYFSYTIRTNLDSKRFTGLMVGMLVGVLIISMSVISDTQLLALMPDNYFRYDNRQDKLYASNYGDEAVAYDLAYIRPQIPSAMIHHPADFELFIPMPERESRKLLAVCSLEEPEKYYSDDKIEASRIATRTFRLACFREQLGILIDGVPADYVMKVSTNPHQNEPGLRLFFPNLSLESGEHNLEIQHLAVKKNEKIKVDHIPFFYLPK